MEASTPARKTARSKRAAMPDPLAPPPAQQDLAPAPAAPAVNDDARKAIATINSQLAEFDVVEAGIADLERKYKDVVFAVDTPKGMREALDARAVINKPIHATEHARKAAKAPVLELGRNIDARAKIIDGRLRPLVNPIDDQIKAQERKEAKRVADLQQRITELRNTPQLCIGKTSAQLQEVLNALDTLPLEEFAEYREQAAKAQFDAQQQVRTLLATARQAEELAELQAKQKAEAERKAAIESRILVDITGKLSTAAMCRTSVRLQALVDSLTGYAVDETFAEFAPAAREEKARVLAELGRLRDEKKAAEDAATAAAAAPAPTPMPTAAPSPADAPASAPTYAPLTAAQATADGRPAGSTVQDSLRGYGGRPSVYGGVGSCGNSLLGRSAADIGAQVASMTAASAPTAPLAADVDDEDPFATPQRPSSELAMQPQRPSDAEILSVLVEHYDSTPAAVAAWLRTFDADAALRQLPLSIA
ncbi:MAG TPA: DUF1351 domain-containing protein [Ramlibacter sp.]|jgi:chemotaxis protein histidine kinase CheA